MKNNFNNYEKADLQKRLGNALYKHRNALGKKQREVALAIEKSEKTYQRWESTGKGLNDLFDILQLFQLLDFSTTEIIDLLGFPPLELKEIRTLYKDGAILNEIRNNSIYLYLQKHCSDLDNVTIEKLLDVITEERLKRRCHRA